MTTTRRTTLSASVIGALALGLTMSAAGAQTTINFLSAEQQDRFDPLIAGFEAKYPDYKVEHSTVPFDSMNATIEARIGGEDSSLDVYLVDSPRVPAYADRGYLLDMEDLRAEVEAVTSEQARGVLSYNGELKALPFWTSTQMMYYNKDLLDAAGIEYPSADPAERLTIAETIEIAKAAQEAGAEWGFVPEQIDRYYQLQAFFESAGGGSGLTGEGNLTPDLLNDAWVSTAEWYGSLFEEGVSPRGIPVDQMSSVFTSGDVVFYIGGPWQIAPFNATEGLNYGVAPVPYFEGGEAVTPTDSWAVAVNPHAGNMEGAMLFAKYMSLDPEGAFLGVEGHPIPPVNAEAYVPYIDGLEVSAGDNGADVRQIITFELANTAVSRPRTIGYVAFEEVMNRTFGDIRNGADARQALEQAQQQLTSMLSRL